MQNVVYTQFLCVFVSVLMKHKKTIYYHCNSASAQASHVTMVHANVSLTFNTVYLQTEKDQITQITNHRQSPLTPSLPWRHLKTTDKSATSETLNCLSSFFALACGKFFIEETHSTERRCRTKKYTVGRCVRASFSPEMSQAGAAKGLIHHLGCMYTSPASQFRCQSRPFAIW